MNHFELTVVMAGLVIQVVPTVINVGVMDHFEAPVMDVFIQVVPTVIDVRVVDHFELTVMDEAVIRVVPI